MATAAPSYPGADRVPLVAGHLALDFVNTTGARASPVPRERLRAPLDLLAWSRRAGILSPGEQRALTVRVRKDPAGARRALARILELREGLYRAFLARRSGQPPRPGDVRLLQRWLEATARHRELTVTRTGLGWSWSHAAGLDSLCGPIVQAAAELLTAPEGVRPGKCGECDWLFLDRTRNRSRRFCKKLCRDRVKARRYYQRRRARAGGA